ncbi:MAG: hypothetical protein AAFY20_11565 [Cyanobacteria bacterium J06639_14]
MSHFSWSFNRFQWPTIQFIVVGLVTAGTVPLLTPAAQAQSGDYAGCARDLTALGVAADTAAAACALSFHPTEVSSCVVDVTNASDVSPELALSACSRDRRPDEVATCVTSIHGQLSVSSSQSVLDHCHRSLLPELYAECVTGLADAVDYGTDESLSRCIAAGYRPEDVAPTYVPK